jgi:tetratricopeptide (TPR) repeat protein
MMNRGLCFTVLWVQSLCSASVLPPLSKAAEYYYSKNDYKQAFQLWSEVYSQSPDSLEALLKVSQLKLLFEGHQAFYQVLKDFNQRKGKNISVSYWEMLQSYIIDSQNRFLKDESQSLYYQAAARIKLGDLGQALTLLNQAESIEKGNLRILESKSQCEKRLGLENKYYETLKIARDLGATTSSWSEVLLEAYYHFRDYVGVTDWYQENKRKTLTSRQKLVCSMALIETGEIKQANSLLMEILETQPQDGIHPMVWFGLGRTLAGSKGTMPNAIQYLERFLVNAEHPESYWLDGWDPFRYQEHLGVANRLVTELAL